MLTTTEEKLLWFKTVTSGVLMPSLQIDLQWAEEALALASISEWAEMMYVLYVKYYVLI